MSNQIVTFPTAKLAKDLNFHEDCYAAYQVWRGNLRKAHKDNPDQALIKDVTEDSDPYSRQGHFIVKTFRNYDHDLTAAPTQAKLHKWMRENHGLHVICIPTVTSSWTFKSVTVLSKRDDDVIMGIKSVSDLPPYKEVHGYDYRTYEDALEAGLLECLEQIKT